MHACACKYTCFISAGFGIEFLATVSEVTITMPVKKKKGQSQGAFDDSEHGENSSVVRIAVEQVVASINYL